MYLYLIALVLGMGANPTETVETDTYDVWYGKKIIGELIAEKKVAGNLITYSTESRTQFNLLGKHSIVHKVEASFKNGMLQSSQMSSVKDGKPKNRTQIQWKGDHYEIDENGAVRQERSQVTTTSVMLYFMKPSPSAKVLSERDASFKKVEPVSSEMITLTSGKKSDSQDYSYQNGQLQEVLVRNPLFTIHIKRK